MGGNDPFSIEIPMVRQSHLDKHIIGSGIPFDVARERGCRSVEAPDVRALGFAQRQCRSGFLLPIWTPDGKNPLSTLRPDHPRIVRDKTTGVDKVLKYELPANCQVRLDVHPRWHAAMSDPTVTIWLTEGIKKEDALTGHDLCAVALLGVWNFLGKNNLGGVKLLADFDHIAWNGRTVNIVFDSDVMTKPSVRAALDRLMEHLQRKGATTNAVYLPNLPNGAKCGVDDYLLTHSVAELRALVTAPQPAPKAAAPMVELLDVAPRSITRPLQLIDGRTYVATWLWTRVTVRETLDPKTGKIMTHNPPIQRTEQRQFVIRDDGLIFGDGGDKAMEELGLQVVIPSVPKDTKLWSAAGVKNYRASNRPDPRDVFGRLVALVDRYMSFDRSLASQEAMAQLVACYALSTWFLDAFDVVGFLWPNGGYGSGKTKLGMLVCEVAYLGEALLSGSTYACLRDLADLGATLLFDDCEALSDAKKADPDKRNLLLAGNRKGSDVAVKEAGPDGSWKTRYVNAYCARLFTAIRLPDPVLGSRSIVVPLVRTADPKKANAEVLDYSQWTCDQRKLLDDLWALALSHLADMPAHQAAVNADAPLMGRNLEPWRAILSVAHWLDSLGEIGLYTGMCDLAKAYQTERVDLETTDLTRLVVRALTEVVSFVSNMSFVSFSQWDVPIEFDVSKVADKVNQNAVDDDLTDGNQPDFTTTKKVGWVLKKLRIQKTTRTAQRRRYQITPNELNALAQSYGMNAPFSPPTPPPSTGTSQTTQTSETTQDPASPADEDPQWTQEELEEYRQMQEVGA